MKSLIVFALLCLYFPLASGVLRFQRSQKTNYEYGRGSSSSMHVVSPKDIPVGFVGEKIFFGVPDSNDEIVCIVSQIYHHPDRNGLSVHGFINGNAEEGTFSLSCGLFGKDFDSPKCVGNIRPVSKSFSQYELRFSHDGQHTLSRVDTSRYQDSKEDKYDGLVVPKETINNFISEATTRNERRLVDTNDIIDLMVVYLPDAAAWAGGESTMPLLMDLCVDEANAIMENSQISLRFRLVHLMRTIDSTLTTPPSLGTLLGYGTHFAGVDDPNGILDTEQNLRVTYKADLLVLIGAPSDVCGIAWVGANNKYSTSATSINCAIGGLTFTHEIGHNLGCSHDRANAGGGGVYSYSYGWCWDNAITGTCSTCQRSVMSYSSCTTPLGCSNCPRASIFSNPNINMFGNPTGTVNDDNARTITNYKATVMQFQNSLYPGGIIFSSSPNHMALSACGEVILTGWNIWTGSGVPAVTLAGIAATVQSYSTHQIVVVAASSASATSGDIVITSNGITSTLPSGFTYEAFSSTASTTVTENFDDTLTLFYPSNTWYYLASPCPSTSACQNYGPTASSLGNFAMSNVDGDAEDFSFTADLSNGGCLDTVSAISVKYFAYSAYAFCYATSFLTIQVQTSRGGAWTTVATASAKQSSSTAAWLTLATTAGYSSVLYGVKINTNSYSPYSNCDYYNPVAIDDISITYTTACGNSCGNPSPSRFPTIAPSRQPSFKPTTRPTVNPTIVPSLAPSFAPSRAPTRLPSQSPTPIPTRSPTRTPTNKPTFQPTLQPTSVPTMKPTFVPTMSPTNAPTKNPTTFPTVNPTSAPTKIPTFFPTKFPTCNPTVAPTYVPTQSPTHMPSKTPTISPTQVPTLVPTTAPTYSPTYKPTTLPSLQPTISPTSAPTFRPTERPTTAPTPVPTVLPTISPTLNPTEQPSITPTASPSLTPTRPTCAPTFFPTTTTHYPTSPTYPPTSSPTVDPSAPPTALPTTTPTIAPSSAPTFTPTIAPTIAPTEVPTHSPTTSPTSSPSATPTLSPTAVPTAIPSIAPTVDPTMSPTVSPSASPTTSPTTNPTNPPTACPTTTPSATPSRTPTACPTTAPTGTPSVVPTPVPTNEDTLSPSFSPSSTPTLATSKPSSLPTIVSHQPSSVPTAVATGFPSSAPSTEAPSFIPSTIPSFIPSGLPTTSPISPSGVPTLSPSLAPSVSHAPTIFTRRPTYSPTRMPIIPSCKPFDREYCSNRGYCSEHGDVCVCDDYLHYWPSEQCALYHNGRELKPDWYCYPNTVDQYCSWMGTCSPDGLSCFCSDPHRTSKDRCSVWHDKVIEDSPPQNSSTCARGDRVYCHNRGTCLDTGDGCMCDDYLHYWASERCATYHDGRELLNSSHCCFPSTVDYYCGWLGTCSKDGSHCECHDSAHRLSAERCEVWHSNSTDALSELTIADDVCPPLIDLLVPTPAPSITMMPTSEWSCTPGDRDFCNNRGYCSSQGEGCVCDDFLHYWPSEKCSKWRDGRELSSGQYCYPSKSDYYCSWMGVCAADGKSCECFDGEHRKSSERCSEWHATAGSSSGSNDNSAPDSTCVSGDRSYCNNRGECTDAGACRCDDPQHYWASERCATERFGPELDDSQCCSPGSKDYYCSWLGTCADNGVDCICDDAQHRLPSERCQHWYESFEGIDMSSNVEANGCPALFQVPATQTTTPRKGELSNKGTMYLILGIGGGIFVVFATVIFVYGNRKVLAEEPSRATEAGQLEFELSSPMYPDGSPPFREQPIKRNSNPPQRKSSSMKLSFRLSQYDEVDDGVGEDNIDDDPMSSNYSTVASNDLTVRV